MSSGGEHGHIILIGWTHWKKGQISEKLLLDRPIEDYHFVSQAEVSIEGVDDREEMLVTDESFDIMKAFILFIPAAFSRQFSRISVHGNRKV